jgi:DNA ligase-1
MTDEILTWQTTELSKLAIASDRHTVYVEPRLVVEIAFNDIQASPHYPGGLALRSARIKRYRLDKRAEDADTIDTVRALHEHRLNSES